MELPQVIRILVIEDEDDLRDLIVEQLRDAGIEADSLPNGQGFEQKLKEYRPHVLLLDQAMPGLKGTEVLEKVRSLVEFSDIPVMMLTDMAQRFGQQKLQAGDLILDLQRRQVLIQNEEIKLTNTEFRLSSELVKNTGEPVSRGKPRRKALGQLNVNDRTIDVHILFLRRKLGNLGDQIETIRGQGYQFNLVG